MMELYLECIIELLNLDGVMAVGVTLQVPNEMNTRTYPFLPSLKPEPGSRANTFALDI